MSPVVQSSSPVQWSSPANGDTRGLLNTLGQRGKIGAVKRSRPDLDGQNSWPRSQMWVQDQLEWPPLAIDCLAAHRFNLCYRIAWRVGEIVPKSFPKPIQLSHSRAGFVVTPSWLTSAWLLCLHNCSLHGCCKFTVCCQSIYVCQLANISPRHQHLWCYFSVCYFSFAAHAER